MKYVGWTHMHRGMDESQSFPDVVGDDAEEVMSWLEDEYEFKRGDWLGHPDTSRGNSTHARTRHPKHEGNLEVRIARVPETDELRGDVDV